MKFEQLVETVGDEPLFDTGLLLAGEVEAGGIRQQLSRWVQGGKVVQLRRGLYALASPFRRESPHPFHLANRLVRGSYVSCQSALAHYGLIPEHVPTVVSVTTGRTLSLQTPLGGFVFHHLQPALFFGMQRIDVGNGRYAFVALAEKALLDLVHLRPGGDAMDYLRELRLQNLDKLDLRLLQATAERSGYPKWRRAAANIQALAQSTGEYDSL